MNVDCITNRHQTTAPWQWLMGRGEALRIDATGHARWLVVTEGRVWLTESGAGPDDDTDVWLEAGARRLLPAGSEWVAEGWPNARVELLEAPPQRDASRASRWRVWPPALRAA